MLTRICVSNSIKCFVSKQSRGIVTSVQKQSNVYHDKIDPEKTEFRIVDPTALKAHQALETLKFGRTFTDHMLTVDWNSHGGWTTPLISEHANLSVSPAALCLHYGIECFEGMKAYVDNKNNIRLFRPELNMKRMASSMDRLALPKLDKEGFLECIKQLLIVDKSWIPNKPGYSLYIRPTAIATSPYLGVQAPSHAKVFVILSPVGPYYPSGFAPVKLLADTINVRAWPGGVGNVKVGGNYGPTISLSTKAAAEHGCQQILWLFGEKEEATEVGAMNIMFVLKKEDGNGLELVTAPLTRGDILPGVTRDSILSIVRGWSDKSRGLRSSPNILPHTIHDEVDSSMMNITVSERFMTMGELWRASDQGRLLEVFGCGTAAIVAPVYAIKHKDKVINVPTGPETAGPLTTKLWQTIIDIQYGRYDNHPWSVVVHDGAN